MIATGRPTRCARCGSARLLQWLADQPDEDGRVSTGAVECRACGARALYATVVERKKP